MRDITLNKEYYFTEENIEKITDDFLNKINRIRHRHKDIVFDMEKSALIIIDMQNYFLSENSTAKVPSAESIIPNINRLIKFFRSNDRPIFFTRHIDASQPEGKNQMEKWWKASVNKSDPLSEISDKLDYSSNEVIIKNSYDSFKNTTLKERVKEKKVEQLVITGVMTHLCCDTTARSAFIEGFSVFMPFDGTATRNLDFHVSTFVTLSHGFVIPTCTSELIGKLL